MTDLELVYNEDFEEAYEDIFDEDMEDAYDEEEEMIDEIIDEAWDNAYNDIMNEASDEADKVLNRYRKMGYASAAADATIGAAAIGKAAHRCHTLNDKKKARLAYKKAKAQGKTGGLSFDQWVARSKRRAKVFGGVVGGLGALGTVSGISTARRLKKVQNNPTLKKNFTNVYNKIYNKQ